MKQIIRKKEKLFNSIIHKNYTQSISTLVSTALYEHAFSKAKSNEDFFDTWFINNSCSHSIKSLFFNHFKNHIVPVVFDLQDKNPFFEFLNNHSEDGSLNYDACNLFEGMVNLFDTKVMYLEKNNITLADFYKKLSNRGDNHIEKLCKNSKKPFFSFLKKEPLQLILEKNNVEIITDPSKKRTIEIKENNSYQYDYEQSTKNTFEDLIYQGQQDINQLNKLLHKFQSSNLNVEIQIKAEGILFNNMNFLHSIKNAIEQIDVENTHFFKHNLGKYLLQSIETYGNHLIKYDTLSDPTNRKNTKFTSEQIDDFKEKATQETLKQLDLLEKTLQQVKENILNQFANSSLTEMRVNTRIMENTLDSQINNVQPLSKTLEPNVKLKLK